MIYRVCAFLPAFAIFFIEFYAGKAALPVFGGSYLVWSICLFFFQMVLLGGYFYASVLFRIFSPSLAARIHVLFFAISQLFLIPRFVDYSENPVENLLIYLFLSYFLVFFTLSAQTVFIQKSYQFIKNSDSHFLFFWSNAGSLAGLLCYPFIIEPLLNFDTQILCIRVILMVSACANFCVIPQISSVNREETKDTVKIFHTLMLSAASCALMVSVNNIITLDIAPAPFLWTIPVFVYLLAYMLSFREGSLAKAAFVKLFFGYIVVSIGIVLLLHKKVGLFEPDILKTLILNIGAQLFFSLILNAGLYEIRPRTVNGIGRFYTLISLGGVAGTAFITFAAPVLTSHIGLPWVDYAFSFTLAFLAIFLYSCSKIEIPGMRKFVTAGGVIVILAVSVYSFLFLSAISRKLLFSRRNFYGNYRVMDDTKSNMRLFYHGTTVHGYQFISGETMMPLAYYGESSCVHEVFKNNSFKSVAVIGLGAGVIASYSKTGQQWDFFEIDPDVQYIAENYFSFLKQSEADITVNIGDGRMLLEKSDKKYDLIVIDVFSSDAIPPHILTAEAFEIYGKHLHENGIVLVNVSNLFIDYGMALYGTLAKTYYCAEFESQIPKERSDFENPSTWFAATRSKIIFENFSHKQWYDFSGDIPGKPWTDQYSSIVRYLIF